MKKSTSSASLFIILFALLAFILTSAQVVDINDTRFSNPRRIFDDDQLPLIKSFVSYFDTLDKLPLLKSDFMVNELGGDFGAEQTSPNIAIDSSGHYAVTWIDSRNGRKEIYAQFFDKNDHRIGNNILVSESANDWNSDPAIAANKKGNFLIAWTQTSRQIHAQRFTTNGLKIGDNFQLNSIQYINTMEPSIVINDNGYFMAVWTQEAGHWEWNTYARLFDPEGNPVGTEIVVNVFLARELPA